MPFRLIATELEFFINGITDKQWLLDRNNHIWDEWASPKKPLTDTMPSQKRMLEERDLGPIYGFSGDTLMPNTKTLILTTLVKE